MSAFGKMLVVLLTLAGLLASSNGLAASASVDRNRVALGESLDDDTELSDIRLQLLENDFEILRQSTSSQTRYVNGRVTHDKQLQLEIMPRRAGELRIPAFVVGKRRTEPVNIVVTEQTDSSEAGQALIFEAEVDRDTVYVQAQVILTLRILQAMSLEDRGVSELELEGAFVKPLEQRSFQRNIDGRRWLVHELRYAIFPEQSGTLSIPAQTFSARESVRRGSLFDINRSGRRLRRMSEPLDITVLSRPATFPDSTWLPARDLSIVEEWSTPPENLRVGESATRTIRLRGEGLQGAQLPPIQFTPVEGLKFYPDQPDIGESEVDSGLLGMRADSAAILATQPGRVSLPEIRIPWWDTEARQTRFAVLPARELNIQPGDVASAPAAIPDPLDVSLPRPTQPADPEATDALPWQIASAVSTAGWLLTLAYLLLARRPAPGNKLGNTRDTPSPRTAFKTLLNACEAHDPERARQALIAWGRGYTDRPRLSSLDELATAVGDPVLSGELAALDAHLYGNRQDKWNGSALADCLRRLGSRGGSSAADTPAGFNLYPGAR